MKLIVCLDELGGMMFNHRRQSRDRVVTEDVLRTVGDGRLWMAGYSESLFSDCGRELCISENFLASAAEGDWCFVEDRSLQPYVDRVETLVIYHWNRRYPSDFRFDVDWEREGFVLIEQVEFQGFSHEKITKEIYRK